MVWKPRLTVACVIEKDGKFLMVEEKNGAGETIIGQPAGHVEYGETILQAAVRETLEETGCIVEPQSLLAIFNRNGSTQDSTFLRFTFVAKFIEEKANAVIDSDIIDTHWLSADDVISEKHFQMRSELVAVSIEKYLQGVRYPLEIIESYQFD